ncbi:RNA polymerase, sigma-24 subunit, ECF subfamily [Alicyclobacillus acidocaldarius subsp. acidocaldarius Tc-4-1]|uniref:RNA polymerase sigma factor n=2 Tax=Alicyclobacillus acidocaldarius TaxID=405212 RepID=F8IJS7_ALIAT|nr:RNA polymerase, sigma-24 subunit, ECF subfamily [Alicyclobacillus acidocaldarius subsp. acidocaldarius Tc-4-1]
MDMNGELSDDMLLAAIARGQRDALEALYDRFERLVYSFAYRVTGDVSHAEEIVQDVFVKVWRQAHAYNPALGKVSTWLLTIARRSAIDLHRRERRQQHESGEDVFPILPDHGPTPDRVAEQSDLRSRIREALAKLPEEQRQVVEWMYFQGYTQNEIAERFGWSLGTVKSRARLAMQKLREELQGVGWEVEGRG